MSKSAFFTEIVFFLGNGVFVCVCVFFFCSNPLGGLIACTICIVMETVPGSGRNLIKASYHEASRIYEDILEAYITAVVKGKIITHF